MPQVRIRICYAVRPLQADESGLVEQTWTPRAVLVGASDPFEGSNEYFEGSNEYGESCRINRLGVAIFGRAFSVGLAHDAARLNLVPFTVKIPEADQDKELPEKRKAEWPGILQSAIDDEANKL